MRIPGARRARAITRAARYRLTRAPLILLYHRVYDLESDPWGISVSPKHFAEQLSVLQEHFRVISLSDLLENLDRGHLPRGAVVLTFDDGYSDNLHYAKPLLERFEAPATLFVASGAVNGRQEFWWDELEQLLVETRSLPSVLEIEIQGRVHRWQLGSDADLGETHPSRDPGWRAGQNDPTRRHAVYYSIYRVLRRLPKPEWEPVIEQLRDLTGASGDARPTHRTLRREELQEISRDGLIEIGSHTATHPLLAALPPDLQRDELESSKGALEDILGRPVETFAYPHGGANDFTPETVRLVEQAGYTSACAAFRGIVSRGVDRYRLPRLGMADWSGEEFERRLRFGLML